jgi:hypothetical protein
LIGCVTATASRSSVCGTGGCCRPAAGPSCGGSGSLVAEIGGFTRFATAEQFIAFVGLVPCEHSSGEHRRQGSITKLGNSQVRRLLVEAAWHARRRPKLGYELARRQRGQHPAVIERAWRCQQRLYQRWQRMAGRGKPHQRIVVACARELAGCVWAIATNQPLRTL